jgi:hypothetical protein
MLNRKLGSLLSRSRLAWCFTAALGAALLMPACSSNNNNNANPPVWGGVTSITPGSAGSGTVTVNFAAATAFVPGSIQYLFYYNTNPTAGPNFGFNGINGPTEGLFSTFTPGSLVINTLVITSATTYTLWFEAVDADGNTSVDAGGNPSAASPWTFTSP